LFAKDVFYESIGSETAMPAAHLDAVVRLKEAIPAYHLQRGEEGVVVGVWLVSGGFRYEVEFREPGQPYGVPVLLCAKQIEVVESQSLGSAAE
jgi:hypothetical protein